MADSVAFKRTLLLIWVWMKVLLVSSEELTDCDWLTASEDGCIKMIECQPQATVVRIWEDCPKDSKLFTVNDQNIILPDDTCAYAYAKDAVNIHLKQELDAEILGTKSCDELIDGVPTLYFDANNINEYPPFPSGDTLPVMEIYRSEDTADNNLPEEIITIQYTDDDKDETSSLKNVLISSEYEDVFTLEDGPVDEDINVKNFTFKAKKKLDFENRSFYKVEYNITSTDEKGNVKAAKHTFFVYVVDEPDNPPFWSEIVPFYQLNECKEEDSLFRVTAQDRDVMVNYAIRYSLLEESEFFEIDNATGVVSRKAPIDREELLEIGISSFSLAILATEFNNVTGLDGEEPNSNQQVSVITIVDCNDEEPEFNSDAYEIVMNEVTVVSGDQVIDLYIVVKDMDEGDNGTFRLETDNPEVIISPKEGKQTQEVTLTARYNPVNSIFDFESQQNESFEIKITATEKSNPNHTNSATVTIRLQDVNDETPFFLENTYAANVAEGTSENTHVLTVEAYDDDISEEFGESSIRYSLELSCNEFNIDSVTGNVTLNMVLDFEDPTHGKDHVIECKVIARDKNGTGLTNTNTTMIAVTIIDLVDEIPQFEAHDDPMEVLENSNEGELVGLFSITDTDKDADIDYKIKESVCSEGAASANVSGWFKVIAENPNPPNFPAKLEVGNVNINREICKKVTLIIQATDIKTDAAYESESTDTENFVITIVDENDEDPIIECEGDCNDISLDEDDGLNPSNTSVLVFRFTVADPDEEDTITLSLSDGGDVMYLSTDNVPVQEGKVEIVDVRTKENAHIDREERDSILVKITAKDSENHTTIREVSVKVNDLNDNRPVMKSDWCGGHKAIEEDDGTGMLNNTLAFQIYAEDADEESPYNSITYVMLNDQIPDSKNTWAPFKINEKTGEVTILLIDDKKALDREQFANWELLFRAYDECDESPSCKVLSSTPECTVNITVKDVNDHDPRSLSWVPNDEFIMVTDFLKKDEDLGYLFTAVDDDEGENSTLTYSILGTYAQGSNIDVKLFRAEDDEFSDSCRLFAEEDFEGKSYTGDYTIILEAKDGGNRSTSFNITVIVDDANDQTPYFEFGGCFGELYDNFIKMEENEYTPGENGEPDIMEVKCDGPNGNEDFIIKYSDSDSDLVNRRVTVNIDMENSTVDNVGNTDQGTLLSYWTLEPNDCSPNCKLKISHMIDREEGTAYNLSLHIINTAEPLRESWAQVRVVVTNKMEYPPYFCLELNCSQVVFMVENDTHVSTTFYEAIDEDNNGVNPGDEEYDNVYYFIIGGDKNYFQIEDPTIRNITLKNMPEGLDRENKEKKEQYSLTILVTNDIDGDSVDINGSPRNDTLNVIIRVGDVNDVSPVFNDDVIFASFMDTDSKGEEIAVIEALDLDLNETLTYEIQDDLQWYETNFVPDNSFKIEIRDSRSAYLKIDFDPKGMTQGYCSFTIKVEDAVQHVGETMVKVYVINEDYQVPMFFANNVEQVQSNSDLIEDIYSSVFQYACTIDSIVPTQDDMGQTLANKTTVYMHFIDKEKNEPVDENIILDLCDNAEVMSQLTGSLSLIGLDLYAVETIDDSSPDEPLEDKIRKLQILLVVVGLISCLLLLLFSVIYCLRTNKLQRKIKVLSANSFESQDKDPNKMGIDMATVPGTNYLAKEHGNHNPVFNESGGLDFNNQDTESTSSGDSVLVGVEDNPEFKSYSAKDPSSGFENPAFGHSIDEVSEIPLGVQGGIKGNPLLNLSGLEDDQGLPSEPMHDKDSLGFHNNTPATSENIDSNFSFS